MDWTGTLWKVGPSEILKLPYSEEAQTKIKKDRLLKSEIILNLNLTKYKLIQNCALRNEAWNMLRYIHTKNKQYFNIQKCYTSKIIIDWKLHGTWFKIPVYSENTKKYFYQELSNFIMKFPLRV